MTASIRLHTLSIEQLIQYSTVSRIWQALFSESAKIRAKSGNPARIPHNLSIPRRNQLYFSYLKKPSPLLCPSLPASMYSFSILSMPLKLYGARNDGIFRYILTMLCAVVSQTVSRMWNGHFGAPVPSVHALSMLSGSEMPLTYKSIAENSSGTSIELSR